MARSRETVPRRTREAPGGADGKLGADEVAVYLRAHPDFLLAHPELLQTLTPPSFRSGENVVDMQAFMIHRLRSDHKELISTSRRNMAGQSRVHEAVLSLLEAKSLEHLVHLVTTDLVVILDLDTVVLGVESAKAVATAEVRALKPGAVDCLLGRRRDLLLSDRARGDPAVFGGAADLVRSQALLRLNFGSGLPVGLLALGSRKERKFHAGQGTELLAFLARVVEHCVREWLDLSA